MDRRKACRNADVGSSIFACTTCGSQLLTRSKWNLRFERFRLFLPPANEVCGKVMFSQACVSHSVYRSQGVSVQGGLQDRAPTRTETLQTETAQTEIFQTETPSGQRSPGQRPQTETPRQRPIDRDPLWTEIPGQRTPGQRLLDRDLLWTETPQTETPRDPQK